MDEKNEMNSDLDPEVIKVRDKIISKIGDKPLEEVNSIIKKLLNESMDDVTRLGALAARLKIIRSKIELLYESKVDVKPKQINKKPQVEIKEEKKPESKEDKWVRVKILEAAEINGKQIAQGVVLDVKEEDSKKLVDSKKAEIVEEGTDGASPIQKSDNLETNNEKEIKKKEEKQKIEEKQVLKSEVSIEEVNKNKDSEEKPEESDSKNLLEKHEDAVSDDDQPKEKGMKEEKVSSSDTKKDEDVKVKNESSNESKAPLDKENNESNEQKDNIKKEENIPQQPKIKDSNTKLETPDNKEKVKTEGNDIQESKPNWLNSKNEDMLRFSFNSKMSLRRPFVILLLIFLSTSCDDLFLRFKYETLKCKKNSFNLDKISIKNEKVNSLVDVQFGDIYHSIKIYEINDDSIVLKNDVLDIEIKISRKNERVDVRLNNTIKRLSCERQIFKMWLMLFRDTSELAQLPH